MSGLFEILSHSPEDGSEQVNEYGAIFHIVKAAICGSPFLDTKCRSGRTLKLGQWPYQSSFNEFPMANSQ
ncbi:MAG: hypothetical protein JST85_14920 [Acidobacteria bacterium]|nr:hypothetical protein [Acidobacteriota bacterium]